MIISHLMGGLGNQLFQYAAGRALSVRLGTPLVLDASLFKRDPTRFYELDRLNIQATSTTPFYDKIFPLLPYRYRAAKIIRSLGLFPEMISPDHQPGSGLPSRMVLLEDRMQGFDERMLSVAGNVYLKGFWQSERYFEAIPDLIRADFTFRRGPNAENLKLIGKIQDAESVAVHVRRGDYVTNAAFGTCDPNYYHRAVDKLRTNVRDPHFCIFSDDPEWTRSHIKFDAPCTYISHNKGAQNFEDLRLMSHCQHFIIANSSFSWWGAWLGANPGKQVYCPQRWSADSTRSTRDLIPDRWLQI